MTVGDTTVRADTVFVETAARVHFGLLDLRGDLRRRFGGIGAAAPAPTLLVSATPAATALRCSRVCRSRRPGDASLQSLTRSRPSAGPPKPRLSRSYRRRPSVM